MTGPRRDPDQVRPYVRGGGGPVARPLHLETLLVAANSPLEGLGPDHRTIMLLCRGGTLAVGDLANALDLPLALAKRLVSQLIDAGHLTVPQPADAPATDLLEGILHGLRRAL